MADDSKPGPAAKPAGGAGRSDADPNDSKSESKIAELLAGLDAKMAALATAQSNTDRGLRSLVDKQVTNLRREIETIRGGGSGDNGGEGPSPVELRLAALEKQTKTNSRDTRMARFFQDFPEARENWKEIMEIMEDENQAALVASRDEHGGLDFYGSYHNALNRVLASKYRAAKATSAEAAAAAKAAKDKERAQADLGGSGSEAIPESLTLADVEKMTPEEMEKAGLTKLFPSIFEG